MINLCYKCEAYYAPMGRVLVGVFFLMAGVGKFMGIEGTAGYIASVGLPFATLLAWLAAAFLVVAAGALIMNYRTKDAACGLAAFTVLVTILFHGPHLWNTDPSQQLMFLKNVAILGGLLFMVGTMRRN